MLLQPTLTSPSLRNNLRETMRGIRSYMGWTHIPDIDSVTGSSDDNPFAGPKLQTPGKVSVQLPTDEWLCRKLTKLNLTLTDEYLSRSAEAGGLQRDQFLEPRRSQAKWYGCHSQQKSDTTETVTSWSTNSSKLNSAYIRIARQAGITCTPPQSRPISQETLRKWEKTARESSVICNQAAGFNRCLVKVQQDMQPQLRAIKLEHKGKSAAKLSATTEEPQFLMDFSSSICQAMAKSMEHLTDFVFVNMANVTLLRRDSYLAYLKAGIKADTLAALRTAPQHLPTLFPDRVIKQVGEHIASYDKGRSGSVYKKGRYHPYERPESKPVNRKQDRPAWKNHVVTTRGVKGSTSIHPDLPRASSLINVTRKAAGRELFSFKTDNELCKFKCKLSCCKTCSYCARALPKERVKSRVSRLLSERKQIKICQKCFLCHSLVLCKTCNKCQKCCLKSACRGQASKLLANLAGSGCWSESGSNPERGPHPPLSDPAKTHKVSHSHKLLCQSPQEPLPAGGITSAYRQKCSGTSTKPNISGIFQPIFNPQAQQQVETYI